MLLAASSSFSSHTPSLQDVAHGPEANSDLEGEDDAEEASKPADIKPKSSGKRRKKKKGSSNAKSKDAADGKAPPVTKEEDLDELLESMNITLVGFSARLPCSYSLIQPVALKLLYNTDTQAGKHS